MKYHLDATEDAMQFKRSIEQAGVNVDVQLNEDKRRRYMYMLLQSFFVHNVRLSLSASRSVLHRHSTCEDFPIS